MLDFEKLPRFKQKADAVVTHIQEWAQTYNVAPALVIHQVKSAHQWCQDNPGRGPRKDIIRFLGNWMRRADQFGYLKNPPRPLPPPPQEKESTMTLEEMRAIREQNFPRKAP